METILIIGIIIGILFLWIILIYNSLIRLRNNVKKSFSGIDVQLKRRADLIPNLINTVKGYKVYEKELLENITKLRTSIMDASSHGDIKTVAKNDNLLSKSLKSLFAVSENYPDLKANQNFLKLQEQLEETENQIAAARRIYNENATYYNNKLQVFPNNIFGAMFGFKQSDLFEATNEERENIKVEF